jgi:NADPH:quinone reductase-like Zn-dependent oxidoreductase
MQSIIYRKYGNEEVLETIETPTPTVKDNEILVHVKAISLNQRDISSRNGDYKIVMNWKFPKPTGADFAGIVTAIGRNIKNYNVGDEVFGYEQSLGKGTLSEYITASENMITHKPKALTFEEASVLGCVYLTALQTLCDKCHIKKGDKIALFGASGGVGTASIQLAKFYGAEVTAIANSANENFCKAQGADHFVAYNKENIFASNEKYDVFFQVFGKDFAYYKEAKNILTPEGIFIGLLPLPKYFFQMLFGKPKFKFTLVKPKADDLAFIAKLANEKVIAPAIFRTFDWSNIKDAHKTLEKGGVNGKIVVRLN